jgi:hypothetical protein
LSNLKYLSKAADKTQLRKSAGALIAVFILQLTGKEAVTESNLFSKKRNTRDLMYTCDPSGNKTRELQQQNHPAATG